MNALLYYFVKIIFLERLGTRVEFRLKHGMLPSRLGKSAPQYLALRHSPIGGKK